jgi:hypothetical protein
LKVLLAFPVGDQQTGIYILNAFKALGCDVIVVDPLTDLHEFLPTLIEFQPNLVFCAREYVLLKDIRVIRRDYPHIKTVCYNVDARYNPNEWGAELLELFKNVHIFYCKPKGSVEQYQQLFPETTVKYLLEGMDPAYHKRVELTDEDRKEYGCDTVFLGTKHSIYTTPRPYGRIGLIDYVSRKVDLRVVSYNECGSGRYIFDDHNKQCQCAKIVLGHCGWADVELANSARDFRVTGAGGFLLTEHVKGIEQIFEVGKEIVTYTTPQDCVEKIRYYLKHEEERNEIAEAGYQRTVRDHSFVNRMAQVIEDVKAL